MRKLVVLPTKKLFQELFQGLHEFEYLSMDLMTWAEASLWATGVVDDALVTSRIDQLVQDFVHDASQMECETERLNDVAFLLHGFCDDMRIMLKQLGLIYQNPPPPNGLTPATPLMLHLLTVDDRMFMHVEVTKMGLVPTHQ